jgi:hypothetical protein
MDANKRNADSELNYQRAKIFFEKKVRVHCSFRDGKFYNGFIISVSDDFFEIHDKITGIQLVFFSELTRALQEYTVREEGK